MILPVISPPLESHIPENFFLKHLSTHCLTHLSHPTRLLKTSDNQLTSPG